MGLPPGWPTAADVKPVSPTIMAQMEKRRMEVICNLLCFSS
jgi:hypothetical protein